MGNGLPLLAWHLGKVPREGGKPLLLIGGPTRERRRRRRRTELRTGKRTGRRKERKRRPLGTRGRTEGGKRTGRRRTGARRTGGSRIGEAARLGGVEGPRAGRIWSRHAYGGATDMHTRTHKHAQHIKQLPATVT